LRLQKYSTGDEYLYIEEVQSINWGRLALLFLLAITVVFDIFIVLAVL
jgi:hypothetical protein